MTPNRILIAENDDLLYCLYRDIFVDKSQYRVLGKVNDISDVMALIDWVDVLVIDVNFNGFNAQRDLPRIQHTSCGVNTVLICDKRPSDIPFAATYTFDVFVKPFKLTKLFDSVQSAVLCVNSRKKFESINNLDFFKYPLAEKLDKSPRGMKIERLNKIIDIMSNEELTWSVKDIASYLNISVTTSRRYLEYLLSEGKVTVKYVYGRRGHPEKRYTIALV